MRDDLESRSRLPYDGRDGSIEISQAEEDALIGGVAGCDICGRTDDHTHPSEEYDVRELNLGPAFTEDGSPTDLTKQMLAGTGRLEGGWPLRHEPEMGEGLLPDGSLCTVDHGDHGHGTGAFCGTIPTRIRAWLSDSPFGRGPTNGEGFLEMLMDAPADGRENVLAALLEAWEERETDA